MSALQVSAERIKRHLDALSTISANDKEGVTRLAYTKEENEAFDYVREQLPDTYSVMTDALGNLFATCEPDAPRSAFIGSHLDTVSNGGRLDGALGVVAALEVVEAVDNSSREPRYPPTVAVLRAEESTRFGRHTIGSRGLLGDLTPDDLNAKDEDGVTLSQAVRRAGCELANPTKSTVDPDDIACFFELHIEQGRVLDDSEYDVGIVTSIRAPVRYRVTVTGTDDHSGATPMELRTDALAGAADMILRAEEIGREFGRQGDAVVTVGDITPVDGAVNKVCGEVSFPIDLRSDDVRWRDRAEANLLAALNDVAEQRSLSVEVDLFDRSTPVELDDRVVGTLERSFSATAAPRLLPSGGGHDAMNFQRNGIPTGLVFVPSVDGVSHSPREETDFEAVESAIHGLIRTLLDCPEL